ncbi:MAG TPA: toll/interleukin-1 receptor domain-containing protein, partial [Chroococcidiopsis sp.]
MIDFQDAFISYGRADSQAFCTTLYERLLAAGCRVWFDQNDIPLGVDFQNQIDDGIEKAHNFLFVISPHSVNSPYCLKEIELALRLNKRIIPLLHVEKISQDTWQQRNPGKGEEDWQAYQAQGLHSCFANMHPAIGKINWVYFREGIDDFEQSLAGLLTIFERQKEYVELHTQLLARSLEWERHYRETRYLLTGDDRTEAENWLSVSFQGEQAPCEPTDLHCEYICESIKNANNLMTQVFLCYSPKDEAIAKVISRALMRQRFTLWSSVLDVEPGNTSDDALRRGIERADNFVFLLSSDSQASKQCQKSLEHAFNYNKRVIPLKVEAASAANRRQKRGLSQIYDRLGDEDEHFASISAKLQAIQAIDFSRHDDPTQMRAALDRLLQDLTEDANYYEQHKNLLVKALRWQEQHRNPSLLLRGHALRQSEAWLRSAKGRSRQPLLPIQDEFIVESQKHPPDASVAVFISYSMADSDFARKLNNALQTHGKSTWFDQESIASGSDFQQEIFQGIESADNFLFVISPNSIESPYCESEVEHAKQLNKRIIPVMYRDVSPADLPAALATTQWVDFRKHQGDFLPNFGELVRALETDLTYVRDHTRLQIRAMEWELEDRDDSFLLRGRQLTRAERWLEQSTTKRPAPTRLQALYVAASLELPKRKIKPRTAAITGVVA